MVKVELPRADWELVLFILRESQFPYIQNSLIKDIDDQVYSQEY
jgi:hypothetical protein